jgi:hypothetical protein
MTALKQNEDPPPQALAQLESSRNVRNVKWALWSLYVVRFWASSCQ